LIFLLTLAVSACTHADGDPCDWGDRACCVDSDTIAGCEAHIGGQGAWRLSKCGGLLTKNCVDGNSWEDAECG